VSPGPYPFVCTQMVATGFVLDSSDRPPLVNAAEAYRRTPIMDTHRERLDPPQKHGFGDYKFSIIYTLTTGASIALKISINNECRLSVCTQFFNRVRHVVNGTGNRGAIVASNNNVLEHAIAQLFLLQKESAT